jgi:ABC-type glycerol-3-phosphate transport system substrate-binding protein
MTEPGALRRRAARRNVRLASASCAAALLAATTSLAAATPANAATSKITLTYLTHFNAAPGTTIDGQIIAMFEKEHPGVVVQQIEEESGTEQAKYETLAAAGEYPNVYDMNSTDAGSIIDTGEASPVDFAAIGYKSQSAFLNTYLPGSAAAYVLNGTLYGIPEEVSNYGAWVIPGDFTAAGVPVPTTWDQVCADGPKLLKMSGNKIVQEEVALPTNLSEAQAIFFDAVSREYGSSDFNLIGTKSYLTSPSVVAAATMLQNLVYKCHAAVPSLNSSAQGADRTIYWDGNAAMMLTAGTWETGPAATYPKVKSEQAYPYPAGPHGTDNDLYGLAYVVPKKASNQSLSWQLAEALAAPGTTWLKEFGLFTGSKASASSPLAKVVPEWGTVWTKLYSTGVYLENLTHGDQIDSIIGSALDSILLGDANVKSTLSSANSQIAPLLNQS